MEWWIGWVIAALLGLPAAVYYSLRLTSKWGENREKRRNAESEARKALADAIKKARDYDSMSEGQFQELIDDARISKKLRRKLRELKSLAEQYQIWRDESWQIVSKEAELASMEFEELDISFASIFHSRLAYMFRGVERTLSECVYRAIYNGNLTFDLARDSVLRDKWEAKAILKDTISGEEKEIIFRDIIEGKEFHDFIERLRNLQDRESLRMLREARAKFLERAKAILKEDTNA